MMRRTELKRTGLKRRSCPVIHKSAMVVLEVGHE